MPNRPPAADPALDTGAADALAAWRAAYATGLAAPRGWWAVTALAWLDEAPQRLGSAPDAQIPLPVRCPALAAAAWRDGDAVRVVPMPGGSVWLDDAPIGPGGVAAAAGSEVRFAESPDAVAAVVLRRGDRVGLRVFDPRQAAARDPRDVAWFDARSGWVVQATAEAAAPDETLPVVDLLGDVHATPVAAWLRFELAGRVHRLVATAAGDGLFVNFRDGTSGISTYGAGRFLRVDAPQEGRTHIDFHRAYHPPCAHTPHATCPLPPLANRLPLAVEAGERSARPH
jgi:uncharacterized protein